jgi:DNA-binding beta-propeller fold protein YncE
MIIAAMAMVTRAGIVMWGKPRRELVVVEDRGKVYRAIVRMTCKKGPDGKPGREGETVITYYRPLPGLFASLPPVLTRATIPKCLTPAELGAFIAQNASPSTASSAESIGNFALADRSAGITPVTSPADDRLYVANTLGTSGRSELEVIDSRTNQIIRTIDVDDRLFRGLALAPDGRRLFALLGPFTLPTGPPQPSYIAYIDTQTNTIVDRFLLPGIAELPQRGALSRDGRYFYFAARTSATGPRQIQIADLVQKSIVGAFPLGVPATNEPNAVAISPDGAILAAASVLGVMFYDISTRTFIGLAGGLIAASVNRPTFHPNGSRVYVVGRSVVDGVLSFYVSVLDTATLAEIAQIPITSPAPNDFRPTVAVLSISSDGLELVLDEAVEGTVNIIDTRTNRVTNTILNETTGGLASGPVLLHR